MLRPSLIILLFVGGCSTTERVCADANDCVAGEACLASGGGELTCQPALAADDDGDDGDGEVDAGPEGVDAGPSLPGVLSLIGGVDVASGTLRGADGRTLSGHISTGGPTTSRSATFTLESPGR